MSSAPPPALAPSPPPRLLDLVRQVARTRFGQDGPGERYADWTRRLILFPGKRHPRDLSPAAAGRFLAHLPHTDKDPLNRPPQPHPPPARHPPTPPPRSLSKIARGPTPADPPSPGPPRPLARPRGACRVRQFSPRTEDCYATWAERFIRFHGLRHPNTMGAP